MIGESGKEDRTFAAISFELYGLNAGAASVGVGVGEEMFGEGVRVALDVSGEAGVSVCAATKEGVATASDNAVEKNTVKN